MGDGMTVSTTPLEWRSRVRAIAQARPVSFHEDDIARRLLLLRESLKSFAHVDGKPAKRAFPRRLVGRRLT